MEPLARTITISIAAILTTLASDRAALASVIFSTGFENSQGYALGQLQGQHGWSGSTVPTVENTTVYDGAQAVQYNATGLSGQNLISIPISYNATSNPVLVIDDKFQAGASGASSAWDVMLASGNDGFIGQIVDDHGTAVLGSGNCLEHNPEVCPGNLSVATGVWNDYQLVVNFASQTLSAYVDGSLLGTSAMSGDSTSLTAVELGVNSQPGTDAGYFDDVSFTGGSMLSTQGGSPSAPVYLFSAQPVEQVAGTIGGSGSADYYSFAWGGGAFSATATVTGANSGASYLFSEGVTGTCGGGASVNLNNGDNFSGTIAFANLSAGQYCIGLDANNSLDPPFTLTFNTTLAAQTPEPSGLVLLPLGLAMLGVYRQRRFFLRPSLSKVILRGFGALQSAPAARRNAAILRTSLVAFPVLMVLTAATPLQASLVWVAIVPYRFYYQGSAAAPTTPYDYLVAAQYSESTANEFTSATLTYPGAGSPQTLPTSTIANETTPVFSSSLYSTQSSFQSAYPLGNYTFDLSNGGTVATETVDYSQNLFPTAIPAFTSASYNLLQGMNSAVANVLNFDAFSPNAGLTPTDGASNLTILDASTNLNVYNSGPLSDATTGVTIPKGTLQPGHQYRANLEFYSVGYVTDPNTNVQLQQAFIEYVGSNFTTGSILSTPGGTTSDPQYLFSSTPISEVTGSLVGTGAEDFYGFNWAGGAFNASVSVSNANSGDGFVFELGLYGNCSAIGSAALNNSNSFGGTISVANLPVGQYCIGLDDLNSTDPPFTMIFNTPVAAESPEPGGGILLSTGLVILSGMLFVRRARGKVGAASPKSGRGCDLCRDQTEINGPRAMGKRFEYLIVASLIFLGNCQRPGGPRKSAKAETKDRRGCRNLTIGMLGGDK